MSSKTAYIWDREKLEIMRKVSAIRKFLQTGEEEAPGVLEEPKQKKKKMGRLKEMSLKV